MGAQKLSDSKLQVIKVPNMINAAVVTGFEKQTSQWLLDPAILHVLDFSDVTTIDSKFYRVISVYSRTLKKHEKFLASIHLRPDLILAINQMGMSHAINAVDGLDKARLLAGLDAPAKPKAKFDFASLNPFIEGTVNTLKVQASMNLTTGKPAIKTEDPDIAIAGVITMNNPDMPGSIALCFPRQTFLGIYEGMVDEKHTEITAEIQDAAGELLNMIYGYAKTKLKGDGVAMDMAIPVILVGEKMKMQMGEKGKSVIIPFESDRGPFHLEVYFKKM